MPATATILEYIVMNTSLDFLAVQGPRVHIILWPDAPLRTWVTHAFSNAYTLYFTSYQAWPWVSALSWDLIFDRLVSSEHRSYEECFIFFLHFTFFYISFSQFSSLSLSSSSSSSSSSPESSSSELSNLANSDINSNSQ
ncbi:hypothetical protein PIB30_039962 [Stylosanthes scabra]|uniref:Uncharacterized protein n=1 Tax=Stylosanthes scabra TaxID=79078 RepID=A0ABU6TF80_9FABA|nr:hypothetical protein [Stylosanthes scabra]